MTPGTSLGSPRLFESFPTSRRQSDVWCQLGHDRTLPGGPIASCPTRGSCCLLRSPVLKQSPKWVHLPYYQLWHLLRHSMMLSKTKPTCRQSIAPPQVFCSQTIICRIMTLTWLANIRGKSLFRNFKMNKEATRACCSARLKTLNFV